MTGKDVAFPMSISKQTMRHRTHEKDYHLITVTRPDGRSLFITRWGKRGSTGQIHVEQCPDAFSAEYSFGQKRNEKHNRGYIYEAPTKKTTVVDEANLKLLLSAIWSKLGPDNIRWLAPDINVDKMRDPPPEPDFVQNVKTGRWENRNAGQPLKTFKEPPPTIADRVAVDPEWGAW
jgi:predicted DNA-binding WGR domain protein